MPTVNDLIKLAKSQEGYLEKSASAYKKNPKVLDSKTEGAGFDNYTKYGRDMHKLYPAVMDFPASWCDCFVDWCFYKTFGIANAKKLLAGDLNDYTIQSAQLYKNKNAYYKKNPKVGDQIFFDNGKNICHTGLVTAVTSTSVFTIEGNTSSAAGVIRNGGAVRAKSYPINYVRINGYGRPNYAKYASPDKKQDSNKKKPDTKKKSSPSDTKKKTTPSKKLTISNTVNTASLNVREKASTSSKVVGTLKKGAKVTIKAVSKDWYKVESKGWVLGKYITVSAKGEVNTASLNVREKASTDSKTVGTLKKGAKVKILNTDSKKNWYLCEKGWVSAKYITVK